MEYSIFRDYCKAENSEDEEINNDLQSRLYAEIYYGSSNVESMDTKPSIKLEIPNNDDGNEELHKNSCTTETSNFNENFIKISPSKNEGTADNLTLIERDDKPDIKSICSIDQTESLHKEIINKTIVNVPCANTVVHSEENISSLKNNYKSMMYHNVENANSDLNHQNTDKTEKDVFKKSEIEMKCTEELRSKQCLNFKTPVQSSHLNSTKCTNNIERNQKTKHNENCNDIFKKYEFSKLFINKLYLEKYEKLEERLQEIEEEKESNLTVADQEETHIEEIKENQQQQQSEKHIDLVDQEETNTKYKVLSRNEKLQKTSNCFQEVTVLSSESESDSEESILEVPIPPKPKPPIIHLQDSDESCDSVSSVTDIIQHKNNLLENAKNKSCTIEKDSDTNATIISTSNDASMTEDIVLNCTEIQRGASSVKEIIQSSKSVQSEPSLSIDESYESFSFDNEDNAHDFQLPSKTITNTNVVYERDKSMNFAEDIMISNFVSPEKPSPPTPNRKRHRESDEVPSTSMEQEKSKSNESKRSKTSPKEPANKEKNKEESWEEYFFRPMSDDVKAFYNESRGQENFDVKEIQRKMSKDPRLWAILDEDLMPDLLRRHRYWNAKCNNCHQEGHQRHNCPDLHKPPQCHMCGSQGHTENRCPQKMCLTCGKKQGTFRKTCESCRTLYCNMCKAVGHKSTECPDLWRRFHQTTRNSEINIPENLSEVMKPADLLYCCNCTKRGHDSSTCNEYRWSQHFPTPAYVSNYTGGPESENCMPIRTNSEDVIPLSKSRKNRGKIFVEGNDDLRGCNVLFSYGTFHTNRPNGVEITRKLLSKHVDMSHVNNFLKNRIVPSFLDQLAEITKFEIKIYYDPKETLTIRVRSSMGIAHRIYNIFIFWFKLEDEDKRLGMHVNLPRNKNKMLEFLTTKFVELENSDDPITLYTQINRSKIKLDNTRDPVAISSITGKLRDLQRRLTKAFHAKPSISNSLARLKKVARLLKKHPGGEISVEQYLHAILVYNEVFLPRMLTRVELRRFLKMYHKSVDKTNKQKNEETKKQKKKKLTPYETFVQKLRSHNKSVTNKKICNNTTNNAKHSSEVPEKQSKSTPIVASTTNESSSLNTIPYNGNVPEYSAENISTDHYYTEATIGEHNQVFPIERIQLPRNQDVLDSNEIVNTVEETNPKIVPSNLISLSSNDEVVGVQTFNSIPNTSNSCNLISIPLEKLECNSGSTTKKKKSKKAKKAQAALVNNSEITKAQITDTNKPLESNAKKVINEAASFNLPCINKAVEEVKKRINDKTLKQEHIDVLQRLIHLEKDHRKYISSFCSYLQ